ncbi:hypothetical protein LBW62_26005, partial [Ralstonia solanacearum]|nr:hypothetical protein [Ralstonia solanacearum]MDB0559610.1 hypothetical protein [Ralstonia solanacearum]
TYTPINIKEKEQRNQIGATDMADYNIYYHRNADNRVDTYIECSNVQHEAAVCEQRFNLFPKIKASITVSYRRGLLKDWKNIQSSISKIIINLKSKNQ